MFDPTLQIRPTAPMRHTAGKRRSCPVFVCGFLFIAQAFAGAQPLPDRAARISRDGSGDELFTNTAELRRISIEISPEGMNTLRKYNRRRGGMNQEREDVPATVREGDLVWTNVAVHLKGAAGSFRPVDYNPALTLNFDKFVEDQRFHGLQKISLNNSVQDPTYVHEKLCREIYTAAGVPVPRADYAMVSLNGNDLGLYVLVEGWNKQFLRRYFTDVRGNLYDGGFSRDINTSDIPVNSGKNPEDHTALKKLIAVCESPEPEPRLTRLAEVLDLERFYTLLALDAMMWNWDGYCFNRNNYRAFHDRASGRFVIMPHGLDQMFWKTDGPLLAGTKGILGRAVLQSREGRRKVLERIAHLRTTLFQVEALTNRVNQLAQRNRAGVAQSGFATAVRHSAQIKVLRDRIVERIASIDQQLAGATNLLHFEAGNSIPLTGWESQLETGTPVLSRTGNAPPSLHINATTDQGSARWATTVWLEEGNYRVSGKMKTRASPPAWERNAVAAHIQIWSRRKEREGVNWDWFPHRESRRYETRGEIPSINRPQVLTGTRGWTEFTCDFDLRQPLADLEIRCWLNGQGEAWFDLESLRISRLPDAKAGSAPPNR